MSTSGYDPFDYGLIKPEQDEAEVQKPQGDPEDMLFATEGGGAGAGAGADRGPSHAGPGLDDLLFDSESGSPGGDSGQVFDSAPPATFKEPEPRKRKDRPRKLSVGESKPSEARPKPSEDGPVSPPWLDSDPRRSRIGPAPTRKAKPESRLALKVASPGASHHRPRSKGGSKLLPVMVLAGGLAGGAYLHLVLDQIILAGLVCAMGLIGSMFCIVLLRSKPL